MAAFAPCVKTDDTATAREEFEHIISGLADPDEKKFLVNLTHCFMRWDHPTALARLRALWKSQPGYRDLLAACVSDTDPASTSRVPARVSRPCPSTTPTAKRRIALGAREPVLEHTPPLRPRWPSTTATPPSGWRD
ncbi:hypothetical protein AB0B25_29520 [Nocardia sp. NPDC049190]|uniref:hypothetical protein n=1 Tax=Nocardia sp. NPDC049190 TaxID=3155650 RepID=UPI0033C7C851